MALFVLFLRKMDQFSNLNVEKHAAVNALYSDGCNICYIMEKLKIPRFTVSDVITQFRSTSCNNKVCSTRPLITIITEDQFLVLMSKVNKKMYCSRNPITIQ